MEHDKLAHFPQDNPKMSPMSSYKLDLIAQSDSTPPIQHDRTKTTTFFKTEVQTPEDFIVAPDESERSSSQFDFRTLGVPFTIEDDLRERMNTITKKSQPGTPFIESLSERRNTYDPKIGAKYQEVLNKHEKKQKKDQRQKLKGELEVISEQLNTKYKLEQEGVVGLEPIDVQLKERATSIREKIARISELLEVPLEDKVDIHEEKEAVVEEFKVDEKEQVSKEPESEKKESPLEIYARHLVESPPGVFVRTWLNTHESRKSNYGFEFTITGMDIMTLAYQSYKVIDLLSKDMDARSADNVKKHLDQSTDQLKLIADHLIQIRKWKPLDTNDYSKDTVSYEKEDKK